jgi:hypothetical protein
LSASLDGIQLSTCSDNIVLLLARYGDDGVTAVPEVNPKKPRLAVAAGGSLHVKRGKPQFPTTVFVIKGYQLFQALFPG